MRNCWATSILVAMGGKNITDTLHEEHALLRASSAYILTPIKPSKKKKSKLILYFLHTALKPVLLLKFECELSFFPVFINTSNLLLVLVRPTVNRLLEYTILCCVKNGKHHPRYMYQCFARKSVFMN